MRTLVACLVASMVVPSELVLTSMGNFAKMYEGPHELFRSLITTYAVTLMLTICVVVPLRFLSRRWDFARGWVATAIGLCIGCLIMAAFSLVSSHAGEFSRGPAPTGAYIRFGLLGAATGALFWLIAKKEWRPNNCWRGP